MRGVLRSATHGLLAVALASVGFGSRGVTPAAANGPIVAINPDHLTDGQWVDVTITGFPTGESDLLACSASVVGSLTDPDERCQLLDVLSGPGGTPPAHVNRPVHAALTTISGSNSINCLTEPSGCVVGVATLADPGNRTSVIASAFAPLVFVPTVAIAPQRNLSDGTTVTVSATQVSVGEWSVAQCWRDFLTDPSAAQVQSLCGPVTSVAVEAGARFTTELVTHDPLPTAGGGSVACGYADCVVVLFSSGEPIASRAVSFGPTIVTADPDTEVIDGGTVHVSVLGSAGPPGSVSEVDQCLLPVGPTRQASQCGHSWRWIYADDWGSGSLDVVADASMTVVNGGAEHNCRTVACGFAVFDGAGVRQGEAAAVEFAPPPTISLDPPSGLLDGQPVAVSGQYLAPGAEYVLQHCKTTVLGTCDEGQMVVAQADGTLRATLPAVQRFTSANDRHRSNACRADCDVVLRIPGDGGRAVARSTFTMATGQVTVSPDTGLTDGQQVHVTGSDFQPTYAGPTIWVYPTGEWIVTQCEREVLDEVFLVGVFRHCSVVPPYQEVPVSASTFDTSYQVGATITKILHRDTTDCTTEPGRCLLALIRLEQDTTVTAYFATLTFDNDRD